MLEISRWACRSDSQDELNTEELRLEVTVSIKPIVRVAVTVPEGMPWNERVGVGDAGSLSGLLCTSNIAVAVLVGLISVNIILIYPVVVIVK